MSIGRILSLCTLALLPFAASAQTPTVDEDWTGTYTNGIAAVVEDRIITVDELRREISPLVPQIRVETTTQKEFDEKIKQVSVDVLQNLIDRILIMKDFERQQMNIPEVYLEQQFDEHIIKEFNGDRGAFLKWLKQKGKTTRQFREELKENIIINFMRGRMRKSESYVSPERIREFYEENRDKFHQDERAHIRMIMLAPFANETTELLIQKAQSITKRLDNGESFAELAREFSQDSNKAQGGDLGWIKRNELAKELADPAFALNAGEYSLPIISQGYVFIMYLEEKREAGYAELEEVRVQIEERLSSQLARKAQKQWLDRLRRDAYIKYYM